jgi:transposase-like protein
MAQGKVRRVFSVELKLQAVERMRAGECVSALARELGVRRKFLYAWKHAVEDGRGFPGSGHAVAVPAGPAAERAGVVRDGAERIRELEALVGRLTVENRFFKGALQSIEELRQARGASSSAASLPRSKR